MPDQRREEVLHLLDPPPDEVRPQIGGYGLDLGQLRHFVRRIIVGAGYIPPALGGLSRGRAMPRPYVLTTASFSMSAQFGPNFASTSIPVSSS
jgi:hypothetical protein